MYFYCISLKHNLDSQKPLGTQKEKPRIVFKDAFEQKKKDETEE